MYKTIVWATDGSESADKALPQAKALAQQDGAELVIVHAVEVFAGSRAAGVHLYADEEELKEKLEQLVSGLRTDGIDARLRVVNSVGIQPAHTIADVARETAADLIVVGTRGHTALAGVLLGSVTQRLLHVAPCAVLAVPPERSAAPQGDPAAEPAGASR
jgi:nucleotide-binding universal stress UspA family protein